MPSYVFKAGQILEDAGYQAYLVGGSLRNLLMGIEPKDFDLTTNALPEKIGEIFPKSIMTGVKYGTVTVLIEDESGELKSLEITTFRVEKEYYGGRWPSEVEFTTKLEDDLKRRDFTVNAMALRLNSLEGYELRVTSSENIQGQHVTRNSQLNNSQFSNIIDLFEGKKDLENKILRAVGDPIERFREDGLRSLRACRLASVYGFEIEEKTFDAIKETLEVAAQVSMERARDEITKLILNSPKPSLGIELMRKAGLLKLYIPELLEGYGIEQNEHHIHDIYQHSLDTVDVAPPEVRLAALFHDIGKSRTKEGGHFYGHDREGAEMTRKIMTRLKFSNKEIEDTVSLVRWHMFYVPKGIVVSSKFASLPVTSQQANKPTSLPYIALAKSGKQVNLTLGTPNYSQKVSEEKSHRNSTFVDGWSDRAIRHLIIRVGGHEQVDKLLKLRIADAVANPKASFNPEEIQILAKRISEVREKENLMSVKDLKISGHDLLELGFKKGPEIRDVLEELLEKVIDDIELNTKEKLIEEAKKLKDSN
jgi:tRNA nucleotidyltransferase (CCA-adding enzyme)